MKLMMMMMEGEWWGRRWVWGAVAAVECRNPEGCSLLTGWGTRAQRSLTDRNTEFRKLWNQTNKYLHRRWRKGLNLSGLSHLSMAHQCLRSWEPPGEAPAQRCSDLKLRPQSDWIWWLSHTQDHKPQTSVVSRVQPDHCGSAPRRKQRPAAPQHCSRRRRWWWWRSLFSILILFFNHIISSHVIWPGCFESTWVWSWGRRWPRAATSCCCRGRSPASRPRRSRRCSSGSGSVWCSPDLWTALQRDGTENHLVMVMQHQNLDVQLLIKIFWAPLWDWNISSPSDRKNKQTNRRWKR